MNKAFIHIDLILIKYLTKSYISPQNIYIKWGGGMRSFT